MQEKNKMKTKEMKIKDKVWSTSIAKRELCEWCGKLGSDPAHIIPRKFLKSRWLLENGLFLCRECHKKFDLDVEFRSRVIDILIGREKYLLLKRIARGDILYNKQDFEKKE